MAGLKKNQIAAPDEDADEKAHLFAMQRYKVAVSEMLS